MSIDSHVPAAGRLVLFAARVSRTQWGQHRLTPTITTGRAGSVGDAWTDDGEPDHLCPVALIAMRTEAETAERLQELRTIHDNAAERVHDALRRSGHYHPAAGLDPVRLNGAEKLLVMASDGEAGAGSYAWPPALSDEKITNARRAIGQYLIINRPANLCRVTRKAPFHAGSRCGKVLYRSR